MKDVGNVTRVMPDKRVESLMKFRKRLADNPDVRFIMLHYTVTRGSFLNRIKNLTCFLFKKLPRMSVVL